MLYRRVAGLIAGLIMSQLVLSRSDLICLQHDNDAATAAVTTVAEAPGGEHHHGQGHEHHRAPTDLPTPADCCQAMTTCSASFDLSSDEPFADVERSQGGAAALAAAQPPSRVESPDPPPPKS